MRALSVRLVPLLVGFVLVLSGADASRASDVDADGVLDVSDNCLRTPNPGQADGDSDGAGDACDCRPTVADPVTIDGDANGVFDACEASGIGGLAYRETFDGETGFPTTPEVDFEGHGGVVGDAVGNGTAFPSIGSGTVDLDVVAVAGASQVDYVAAGAEGTTIAGTRDIGLGAAFEAVGLWTGPSTVNGVGIAATAVTSQTSFRTQVTDVLGSALLEVLESDSAGATLGSLTVPLPVVPVSFTLELLIDRTAGTAVGILYDGTLVYMTPPLALSAAVAEPVGPLGAVAWVVDNIGPASASASVDSLEWFAGSHGPLQVGDNLNRTIVHDGAGRFFDVYVPSSFTGSPIPLVVDMHGMTSNKTEQAQISGWKALSEDPVDGGFAVAWPQGLFGDPEDREAKNPPGASVFDDPLNVVGPSWNAGEGGGAAAAGVDDVGFIEAMVDEIAADLAIDRSRVYATGLSNGGALTHKLACEAEGTFAAGAAIASPLPYDPLTDCQAARPIPFLTIQGDTDQIVPYGGGHLVPSHPDSSLLPIVASAQDSFLRWRDLNGCSEPPTQTVLGPNSVCDEYDTCTDGVKTELCTITGLVELPGPLPLWEHVLYFNVDAIDLAREAWAFMSQFQRPRPNVDGIWQLTTFCSGQLAASVLLDFAETGGGVFTSTRVQPCGLQNVFTDTLVPIDTCSSPDPLTCTVPSDCSNDGVISTAGDVTYPADPAQYAPGLVTFDPVSISDPPTSCGSPWTLAEETTQARVDGTIRHVTGVDADHIDTVLTPGQFQFFDDLQTLCLSVPAGYIPPCVAEMRRAGLEPNPTEPQSIEPIEDVTVTFAPGALNTTASLLVSEVSTPAVPIPPEFSISGAILYDIELEPPSALSGSVEICLPYPDVDADGFVDGVSPPLDETTLKLLHQELGTWIDVTTSRDGDADEVCGAATSFSQFAVPEPAQLTMLLPGLSLLAALARRRRQKAERLT